MTPKTPDAPAAHLDIEALEKLCEEATPGPWEYRNEYGIEKVDAVGSDDDHGVAVANGDDESDEEHERGCRDMAFIAAARTALPSLLRVHRWILAALQGETVPPEAMEHEAVRRAVEVRAALAGLSWPTNDDHAIDPDPCWCRQRPWKAKVSLTGRDMEHEARCLRMRAALNGGGK